MMKTVSMALILVLSFNSVALASTCNKMVIEEESLHIDEKEGSKIVSNALNISEEEAKLLIDKIQNMNEEEVILFMIELFTSIEPNQGGACCGPGSFLPGLNFLIAIVMCSIRPDLCLVFLTVAFIFDIPF